MRGSRVKEGSEKFPALAFPKLADFLWHCLAWKIPDSIRDEHTFGFCVLKHCVSLCEGGSFIFHNFSLRNKSQQTTSKMPPKKTEAKKKKVSDDVCMRRLDHGSQWRELMKAAAS